MIVRPGAIAKTIANRKLTIEGGTCIGLPLSGEPDAQIRARLPFTIRHTGRAELAKATMQVSWSGAGGTSLHAQMSRVATLRPPFIAPAHRWRRRFVRCETGPRADQAANGRNGGKLPYPDSRAVIYLRSDQQ